MAQEDQTQKCSNSSSGGGGGGVNIATSTFVRSSKKSKQKKVPQRGLGVAQLEKIRLEEQQKKDAASILPSPSTNLSPPTKPSFLSVSIPNYHPSNQSSSIPFPSPPPPPTTNHSSPNSMYRPPQLVQNIDMVNTNDVSLTNPLGWSSITGHENVPKLWSSCEYNCENENSEVDPGLAFRSNLELPYEFNPIWALPGLVKRAQQYQQPSSSMVHVSSASSSSSVLNYQMEPPSNQSYHGKYTPMWPEEEKIVGMKRPYPFSLDNPPGPSFHYKLPPTIVHPISSRSDESASCVNGGTFNFEPGNTNFRDGPSCSTSISEPNSKKSIKENGVFYGDFLTLAPPTTTLTSSSSKFKHHSTNLAYYNSGFPDFDSLPYQGSMEDAILPAGSSGLNQQQQPYYSFLPPAMVHVGQSTTIMNNCNGGEVGGSVDLNLKL